MTRSLCPGHILGPLSLIFIIFILTMVGSVIAEDSSPHDNNWRCDAPLLLTQRYHGEIWSTDSVPAPRYSVYEPGSRVGLVPWDVAHGDLDDDGIEDLVYYDEDDLLYAIDGATGKILWMNSTPVRQEYRYIENPVVIADIDSDGDMEVLYSEKGGWLNIADGRTGSVVDRVFVGAICTAPRLVDLDGDGWDELIIGSVSSEFSPLLTCINGRTLSPMWTYTGPMTVAKVPAVADIDFDGALEVVVTGGYHRFIGPPPRYYYSPSNHVVALDGLTGEIEWEVQLPSNTGSYPVIRTLSDEDRCEIFIPAFRGPREGYVIDGTNGSVIDTMNYTGSGYIVYGDWDGDGDDETFYRGGYWANFGGLYLYENGLESCLVSSSIAPTVAQFTLVDWDNDGRSEVLFNSRDFELGRWNVWMIGYGQENATEIWKGAIFCFIGDLDDDGTSEMLLDWNGTLVLVGAEVPEIKVSMHGLDTGSVTYPISVVNEIKVTIEFQTDPFSVEWMSISIGNDSVHTDIDIDVTTGELHKTDGLEGSVSIEDHQIQVLGIGRGYQISIHVLFDWRYPITDWSRISAGAGYNEDFRMGSPEAVEFRVEKGIEFAGAIRLSSDSGEPLYQGNWTSSKANVTLSGLSVVHMGSGNLLVPRVFGMTLTQNDNEILTVPMGGMDADIEFKFNAPTLNEGVITYTFQLVLADLVSGAYSGPPIVFDLIEDGEPPIRTDQWPMTRVVTNKATVLLKLNMSDGYGSGIDAEGIHLQFPNQNTSKIKYKIFVAGHGKDVQIITTITFPVDDRYFIHWSVPDEVGNRRIVEISITLDKQLPKIRMIERDEWVNTTTVDIAYGIDGINDLQNALKTVDIITLSGEVVIFTILTGNGYNGIWNLTVDFEAPGRYLVTVSVKDEAGNVAIHTSMVNIDITPPTIEPRIPSILNTSDGSVQITVGIDDGMGSGVEQDRLEYRFDGDWVSCITSSETTGDIQVWFELDRDKEITLRASDRAGNMATTPPYILNLNEPPVPRISSPLDGTIYQEDDEIILNGFSSEDPDGQTLTFEWKLNGDVIGNGLSTENIEVSSGDYSLVLIVSDGFHMVSSDPMGFSVQDHRESSASNFNILPIILFVIVIVVFILGWVIRVRQQDSELV